MLLGSNVFMGTVSIRGEQVQLGDIVRQAVADGRFTTEAWNALTEHERDLWLVNTFYKMKEARERT